MPVRFRERLLDAFKQEHGARILFTAASGEGDSTRRDVSDVRGLRYAISTNRRYMKEI